MSCPRRDANKKLEKFRNQQKMISIYLKKLHSKTRKTDLIPRKLLQKEKLNILEKGINVLRTK